SDFALAGPEDIRRRAIRAAGAGASDSGAVVVDLRTARTRRHGGSRACDSHHECGALLPAARARALDVVAVLDGPQHRTEVVSHRNLQAVSTHGHSRSLRFIPWFPALRRFIGQDWLHQRREEDLVGYSPASMLSDARVSCL